MAFVPLFCQSHYSPLGVSSCLDLVRRARSLGYSTLGLCDEATMGGYHAFDEACRAQGVRPVFGCRLSVEGLMDGESKYPLDFLIETEQGYRNLVRILTQFHDAKENDRGFKKKLNIKGRTAGLRVITPPDGELIDLVRRRDRLGTEHYLTQAMENFGYGLAIGTGVFPEEPDLAPTLRRLAEFIRLPLVAAPRVYFPEPSDAAAFSFLKHPDGAPDRQWKSPSEPQELPALFAEEAVVARFPKDEDCVHESGEIARRCVWRPGLHRRIIPTQDFERGFDANSYLFDLIIRGATERYGEISEQLKQRLNAEFEEVKAADLSTYLLLYRQIMAFLDDKAITRGFGRGGIVASLLAYCLGITKIDPLQYHLAPRPLGGETETLPVMKIEIPASDVPTLLQWFQSGFGEGHVAQIGQRQELRRDQMLDELAQWAGMTGEEKALAHRQRARQRSSGMARRLQELAGEKRSKRWRDPAFLLDLSSRLAPRPRKLTSAGALWTLSAEPLEYVIPARRLHNGDCLTDIGEAAIDQLGAPRLEFAPHHLLNLLDRACRAMAESEPGFSLNAVPLGDRATFELIARGDTAGIPPLEGITVKSLLRREKPSSLLQLLKVKTEANRGRTAGKPRELIDELPDVLISYQCAYLKANDPEAYFAAALSSAPEYREDVSILAHAVRRAGIEMLPPDINLSSALCTVQGGKIRLGLLMVRQFGKKAWDEIHAVRRGGSFQNLAEFCERVSTRIVNHRLLLYLISAGAMDCFAQSRARMAAQAGALLRRSRSAVSAREREPDDQYTLFDLSSLEKDSPQEEEEIESDEADWDEETTAEREREALGFNPRLDPTQRFRLTLESLDPLSPSQIRERMKGRMVRVAGMIMDADAEGPLNDEEDGALIDLEGMPVWISPNLARLSAASIEPGSEVLILGEVDTEEGYIRLKAHGVWRLQDLEDQGRRVARIRIDLTGENKATIKHLTALMRDYKGESSIDPFGYTSSRGLTYRLLRRRKVFFCSPLYQGLCRILPQEHIELFDDRGQELRIALSGDSSAREGTEDEE